MRLDLRGGGPLVGSGLEDAGDEVARALGDEVGEGVDHADRGALEDLLEALGLEGERTAEERVEDAAERPGVDGDRVVGLTQDDLGRDGVRRTAPLGEGLVGLEARSEAKVAERDLEAVLIDEHVFDLEIAVGDLVVVAELDGVDDLLEDDADGLRRERAVLADEGVEVARGRREPRPRRRRGAG